MFSGTSNYGESPYVIYFCFFFFFPLFLFRTNYASIFHYKIDSLEEYTLTLEVPISKMVKHTQTIHRQIADKLFEHV